MKTVKRWPAVVRTSAVLGSILGAPLVAAGLLLVGGIPLLLSPLIVVVAVMFVAGVHDVVKAQRGE